MYEYNSVQIFIVVWNYKNKHLYLQQIINLKMASQSVQIEPLKSQIQNLNLNDQNKEESELHAQINKVTQDPEYVSGLSNNLTNLSSYPKGNQRDF